MEGWAAGSWMTLQCIQPDWACFNKLSLPLSPDNMEHLMRSLQSSSDTESSLFVSMLETRGTLARTVNKTTGWNVFIVHISKLTATLTIENWFYVMSLLPSSPHPSVFPQGNLNLCLCLIKPLKAPICHKWCSIVVHATACHLGFSVSCECTILLLLLLLLREKSWHHFIWTAQC